MKCFSIDSLDKTTIKPYIVADKFTSSISGKDSFQIVVGNDYGIKKRIPLSVKLVSKIDSNFTSLSSIEISEAKVCIGGSKYPVLDYVDFNLGDRSSKSALVKINIHSGIGKNLKLTSASYDCRSDDFDMYSFVPNAHIMNSQLQGNTNVSTVVNGLFITPHTAGLFESGATDLNATLMTKYEEGIFIMPQNSIIRVMEYILCFYDNDCFNWGVTENFIKWDGIEFNIYSSSDYFNELSFNKYLTTIIL